MLYPAFAQKSDVESIFKVNPSDLVIDSKMTYEELCLMIRPYLVTSPSGMINKDKYVSSLILVQDSKEKSKWAQMCIAAAAFWGIV